jgi:hypothetical protein
MDPPRPWTFRTLTSSPLTKRPLGAGIVTALHPQLGCLSTVTAVFSDDLGAELVVGDDGVKVVAVALKDDLVGVIRWNPGDWRMWGGM